MVRLLVAWLTLIVLLLASFASPARADEPRPPTEPELIEAGNLLIRSYAWLARADHTSESERCSAYRKALQMLETYDTLKGEYGVLNQDVSDGRAWLEARLQEECNDGRVAQEGGGGQIVARISISCWETAVLVEAYLYMDQEERTAFLETLDPAVQDTVTAWIAANPDQVETLVQRISQNLEEDRSVSPEVIARGESVLAEAQIPTPTPTPTATSTPAPEPVEDGISVPMPLPLDPVLPQAEDELDLPLDVNEFVLPQGEDESEVAQEMLPFPLLLEEVESTLRLEEDEPPFACWETAVLVKAYLYMAQEERAAFLEAIAPNIEDALISWIAANPDQVETLVQRISQSLEEDRSLSPEVIARGESVLAEAERIRSVAEPPDIPLMSPLEEEPVTELPVDERALDLEFEQPSPELAPQTDLLPELNNLIRCLVNRDCAAWEGRE